LIAGFVYQPLSVYLGVPLALYVGYGYVHKLGMSKLAVDPVEDIIPHSLERIYNS